MGDAQTFVGFLLVLAWVAVPLAQLACLYFCCTRFILNKVSTQQFNGLVSRHEESARQIIQLRQSRGKHQVALKQLRSDLKAVNEVNKKNIQQIDNLYQAIRGSNSKITTNGSTYKPYVQNLQSESDFQHDD